MHYVYLIQEYPLEKTPYCKIGHTNTPLRRLEQLQAGNPRYLRPYCQLDVKPNTEFGIRFDTKEMAIQFEAEILERLKLEGVRISRDGGGKSREWLECHPDLVWKLMITLLSQYLKRT